MEGRHSGSHRVVAPDGAIRSSIAPPTSVTPASSSPMPRRLLRGPTGDRGDTPSALRGGPRRGLLHLDRDPCFVRGRPVGDAERHGRLCRGVQSDRFHPSDHRGRPDRLGDTRFTGAAPSSFGRWPSPARTTGSSSPGARSACKTSTPPSSRICCDAPHRPPHRRSTRRARPDGRDHQCPIPASVPRVRGRSLRVRDDRRPRSRRRRREDTPVGPLRPGRDPSLDPALRHRPRVPRRRRFLFGRSRAGRPHRHELRLPDGEGDPARRRRSPSLEARSVPIDRGGCGRPTPGRSR